MSKGVLKKLSFGLGILFLIGFAGAIGWFVGRGDSGKQIRAPISIVKSKPLDKYTIENLATTNVLEGSIARSETLSDEEDYASYLFTFEFNPSLDGKTLKKTTGQINVPEGNGPFPIVVMFRGYIDQERYITGDGTRRAADVFTKNGFITVAPDFLGYGGSDDQAENIFESRFQTYVTVLSLMKSLSQIESWDGKNVFIWGHSNGGQIALTYLEITASSYPTTLWAPVSKPFPYSILYYTDAAEDRGKLIRRELAEFEEHYDPDLYAIDLYIDRINTPLYIHQGAADSSVPVSWSDELVETLEDSEKDLTYRNYPGTNHNMVPSWNTVVSRDITFFESHLE